MMRCLFILIGVIAISCNERRKQELTLDLNCAGCAGKTLEIFQYDIYNENYVPLFKTSLEKSESRALRIPLSDTAMVFFSVKANDTVNVTGGALYAGPGAHVRITSYSQDSLRFEGDRALVNSYLNAGKREFEMQSAYRAEQLNRNRDRPVAALAPYFAKLRSYSAPLNKRIRNDPRLSDYHKQFLTEYNDVMAVFDSLNQVVNFLNRNKGEDPDSGFVIRTGSVVKFDPTIFNSAFRISENLMRASPLYVQSIRRLAYATLFAPLSSYLYADNCSDTSFYNLAKKIIYENAPIAGYHETVLTWAVAYFLNSGKDYGAVEPAYLAYKKDFPGSTALPDLTKIMDHRRSLFPGTEMRDFEAVDLKGKKFRLSELRGKTLYIDFWATWCSPCVEEMPFSAKLEKNFAHRGVTFVYCSFDRNLEAWKKYLKAHPELRGIHINVGHADRLRIKAAEAYRVGGIPHYVLIGKDGKIRNADAERPSFMDFGEYLKN